jgi:prepilin-type N-terminal cleavage/methylation domain-containing protein
VKRGLKYVRCPIEDFCRLRLAKDSSPAGFSMIELLAVTAILLLAACLA